MFHENSIGSIYLLATPFHVVVILFEMYYSIKHKKSLYTTRDTLTTLYLAVLNFAIDIVMKGIAFGVMFYFYKYKIITLEHTFWYWLALVVLQDLAYYFLHLLDHSSRLFWAIHVTHHNSEYFNIATGFRSSVFQPLYRYLFFAPIAFLGFNPFDVMAVYAIVQVYGTWVHTQTIRNMGWLEYILVTPSHHRVHHACNARYLDRNMGMAFIIWDKIFGTFEKEDPNYEPVKFGITVPVENKGPVNIVFHELKSIWKDASQPNISFKNRLQYIFYPPGWNHLGNGKTSKQVRTLERLERSKIEKLHEV
ncbi:sterol desaturase family protein [Flavobacterium croceum]|uniref:sterol desaturase family protein n=1 Tax=Flavobacterium croceum TaxID=370975 RepID=UPI0024A98E53|nr:sterol desaturase family protein [Flavobacterium croceum]